MKHLSILRNVFKNGYKFFSLISSSKGEHPCRIKKNFFWYACVFIFENKELLTLTPFNRWIWS